MAPRKKTAKTLKALNMINGRRKPGRKSHDEIIADEGFEEVEAAHLAGFWRPEIKGEFVRGKVGEPHESVGLDGKPNVYYQFILTSDDSGPVYDRDKNEIDAGSGMTIGVGGWKMLLMFLRGKEGEEVKIVYWGEGKARKGMNAPKLFRTFVRKE